MRNLAFSLVLLLGACSSPGSEPMAADTTGPSTAQLPAEAQPLVIEAVLDGDSLRATLQGEAVEIRLLGINAPDQGECGADEAARTLAELVGAGDTSVVAAERDQYGRLLVDLFAGGTHVNRELVTQGQAIALAFEHELLPDLLAAEEEAVDRERGIWSPGACGSDGRGREVTIWGFEPDAPGRDDRNPNGEWVAITTDGPPIDLSGWVLRDESTRHRFTFPDGFELATGQIVTIRSGCGDATPTELYWCADGTVWTNSGDTVLLLDAHGAVMQRERYLGD